MYLSVYIIKQGFSPCMIPQWHRSKDIENSFLLQAAEARCRRLEATAAEHAHLLAEQEPQQRELQQWRALVGDLPDEQRNPQALTRTLDELRAQALALSEQASQHKAESFRLQGGPLNDIVGAHQHVHAFPS